MADYTITGDGINYIGYQGTTPIAGPSSSVVFVINAVFTAMSSGQSVEFIGTFTWASQVTLDKNITMDFGLTTRATVTTLLAPTAILLVRKIVTIKGGHWIGTYNAGGEDAGARIQFGTVGSNSIVEYIEAENFVVAPQYSSIDVKIRHCDFRDNTSKYCLVLGGLGNYIIDDCTFLNIQGGMWIAAAAPSNRITGCKFGYLNNHAIYLGGSSSGSVGGNIITGNEFHHQNLGAALHIKCNNNQIYNNDFHDFGTEGWAFSIYSEYAGYQANDNDIHNNTFSNLRLGIKLGHDLSSDPVLRNKIHDNTFTNVTNCIMLNWLSGATATVEHTKIYYNDFHACANPFPTSSNSPSLIKNTVIAHNIFDPPVPEAEVVKLKSYVNTMIYGNIGLADYNPVTDPASPYYIPPRAGATYTLTISATVGGTTSPATGTWIYNAGTVVSILTMPLSGYVFDHWELDGINVGSTSPYSVLMDTDHSILAVFVELPPPPPEKQYLTIVAINGQTDPAPTTYTLDKNSSIIVTATPSQGYTFKHWLFDNVIAGTDPTITVVMDANHTLVAVCEAVSPAPLTSSMLLPALGLLVVVGIGYLATRKKR